MTTPNAVSVAASAVIVPESRWLSCRSAAGATVAGFVATATFMRAPRASRATRGRRGRRRSRRDDDLRLGPALELEVVVERRAREHAALRELEGRDLHHDRERLGDEDDRDEREEELVLRDHGDEPERASERQGAGIAHEELRGVRVEPDERDRPAG